jgi:hypothetical protein
MDTKKIAATFALLVIALGIAGFAYAHWTDTVYIEGTVTTGCVGLEWSFDYELYQNKPVATLLYEIDGNNLYITLDNVYPCLQVEMWIDVHNTGDIPMKLHGMASGTGGDDITSWIEVLKEEFYGIDGNGDGVLGSLEQLDSGDYVVYHVLIHFMQNNAAGELMPQDAHMTFWYTFEWWNWNE